MSDFNSSQGSTAREVSRKADPAGHLRPTLADELWIVAQRYETYKAEREARRALLNKVRGNYIRETFVLPPAAARQKVREVLDQHPYRKFGTSVDRWRWLKDGQIEFTIKRMPTAHWRADLLSHLVTRSPA